MADNEHNPESGDTQQQQTENATANEQQNTSGGSNNKALKIVLIIVGVLILLGVLAAIAIGLLFNKVADEVSDAADEVQVETNGGDTSDDSTDNGFSMQTELPDDFPQEIPVFDPAEVISSSSQTQDSVSGYSATWSTQASTQEVSDFYQRSLSENGWQTTSTSTSNNRSSYVAEHDNGLQLRVVISAPSDDESGVNITASASRTADSN